MATVINLIEQPCEKKEQLWKCDLILFLFIIFYSL